MSQNIALRRRPAGQNEHRCITRQQLGFYRTLTIGAVYTVTPGSPLARLDKRAFVPALKHCIARHPILSTVVLGSDTESPEFVTPQSLNLKNHIQVLEAKVDGDEQATVKQVLAQTCDYTFDAVGQIPPWKIVVTPLSGTRLLVLLAFYHSHGDGKSGLAFHQTILEGLNAPKVPEEIDIHCEPPTTALLPPLEEAGNLTVSWSYLLAPLLGAYLPTAFSRALGFQASTAAQDKNIWCGGQATFPSNIEAFRTGIDMVTLPVAEVQAVLRQCRANNATFTGLLHQLITRALSEALPNAEAFSGDTAVDLRQRTGGAIGNDDMSLCVTVDNEVFPRSDVNDWHSWTTDESAPVWEAARKTSENLVRRAGTLHDQPIGLLKYLNDFRSWMCGKMGKGREASYEISNLVLFSPSTTGNVAVERVIFAQPANAVGPALNFNTVSTKGGPFVLTITWQFGSLELEQDEKAFVACVGKHLKGWLQELASANA